LLVNAAKAAGTRERIPAALLPYGLIPLVLLSFSGG
jgi:hypothetical protein